MEWSNLARVVYARTYARNDTGTLETHPDTVERMIAGNIRNHRVDPIEVDRLRFFLLNRKGGPGGRGYWFSGAPSHDRLGGAALCNCWGLVMDDWQHYVVAMDLLMLGGGVGMSVESEFIRHLPPVKRGVVVTHKGTKDADFIVPDSREGWCELLRRVLEAFFVTGKSFTYSTVCVRGYGEKIHGFGGKASGPIPLIAMVEKLASVLVSREGKRLHSIDAGDLLCIIAEMVVSGNVRRSALIILGDAWDKEFLRAKRWDLGTLPSWRSSANWSIVCDDIEDVHPAFWQSYKAGEPIGVINRANIQKFGRMGTLRPDRAITVNPCGEAPLENGECCNLLDIPLSNLDSVEEFLEACRLFFRWGKRVAGERYHHELSAKVIARNQRVGVGITGCLNSSLFTPDILDRGYEAIQLADAEVSAEYNVPLSVRTTTMKPGGTVPKMYDCLEGVHAAWSRHGIQRVRFSSDDDLVPRLRDAGHHMEPERKLDGTTDHATQVVDFYVRAPDGAPVADEDWDLWKQLNTVKMVQRHWSDQSVSVTAYYKKDEIPALRDWLADNLCELKSVSFLCHNDHGFDQAPKEKISREDYERMSAKIKPVDLSGLGAGKDLDLPECASGACPVK